MKFGERLKKLREASNMTMDQLADAAGISPEYVSLLESGKRNPSFVVLGALAEALKIEASALLKEVVL